MVRLWLRCENVKKKWLLFITGSKALGMGWLKSGFCYYEVLKIIFFVVVHAFFATASKSGQFISGIFRVSHHCLMKLYKCSKHVYNSFTKQTECGRRGIVRAINELEA